MAKPTLLSIASPGVRTSPHVSREAASGPLSPTEPSQRRVPQRRGGGQVVQSKRVSQDAAQTFKNIVDALFGGKLASPLTAHGCMHARMCACQWAAHGSGGLRGPRVLQDPFIAPQYDNSVGFLSLPFIR